MSHEISFGPLSLADVFSVEVVNVYDYDGDLILTIDDGGRGRLIHLFENEVEGRTIYGLNKGQPIDLEIQPSFIGKPAALEISFAKDEMTWDFKSMLLQDDEGLNLRINRNDLGFPEPTFTRERAVSS